MKKILLLLLIINSLSAQSGAEKKSVYDFDLKLNHLIREQFYSATAVYPVWRNFFVAAEYGYLYYHRVAANAGYRFDLDTYYPYLIAGGFYQRENFSKKTYYEEFCLQLGGGLEADLSHNFFFNFETVVLSYQSVNYSMRKIKYRETYEFGHTFDYSVSAGLGYRFHF